ncbi:MAG: hypothetical protein GXP53_13155 [Deltaproteobacteria bacterium]|nr:hypothetical protein [Deltaproteobacteria bacterium]
MTLIQILKIICLFAAAVILGNMFLDEVKNARIEHKPWYAPYLTIPGLLIIIAILLPLLIRLLES